MTKPVPDEYVAVPRWLIDQVYRDLDYALTKGYDCSDSLNELASALMDLEVIGVGTPEMIAGYRAECDAAPGGHLKGRCLTWCSYCYRGGMK